MPTNKDTRGSSKARKSRSEKLAEMSSKLTKKRAGNDGGKSDSDHSEDEVDENGKLNLKQYREMLAKMYPSRHMREKADATSSPIRRSKRLANQDPEEENVVLGVKDKEEASPRARSNGGRKRRPVKTKRGPKSKRSKSEERKDSSSESSEEDEELYEQDSSSDDSVSTTEAMEQMSRKGFNIIFMMGGEGETDEDYEDEMEEDSEYSDEEESETDDSDYDEEEAPSSEEGAISDVKALEQIKSVLDAMPEDARKNGVCKSMVEEYERLKKQYEKSLTKKSKKEKSKNARQFKGLLKEKNVMNDMQYFKNKMTPAQQQLVIRQLEEVKEHCMVEKPYRIQLLSAEIPPEYKAVAYKKVSTLRYMEPGGGEYYKMKQWVDTFMQIPFGQYKNLPCTISDGIDTCSEFMQKATATLDDAVYGMNDAKYQIMQLVGQWITNPSAAGTALAIKGPMGTGKTTLVKDGISKILGRDFAFIALGGATDSSFLEGHSYTYEGAVWGKIVDILVQSKSMNPVIFLDELDKVSSTPKGEEIIGILTHLTDTSQNSKFHDKYFSEIDFDLSRCLFIFSYNDESLVNPILRDRMYRVETTGYKSDDKIAIANKYLLPKIREQVKIEEGQIIIPDSTLAHIIERLTENEKGVRNLKRCLEIIYTKLNLYRLMKPDSELFNKAKSIEVKFPMTVTTEVVDKLIEKNEDKPWLHGMYI